MGGGGILIGGGKHKYATFYKSLTKQFKLQLNDIYQNMIGQCKSNCHTIVGTETLVSILSKWRKVSFVYKLTSILNLISEEKCPLNTS